MNVKPGYKKTEVGLIPEEWVVQHLGCVAAVTTGRKDVNEGNPDGEYPFFTCSRSHTYSNNYSFDTEAILVAGNGEVGNLHYYRGKFEAYQRTYVVSRFTTEIHYVWHQLKFRLAATLGLGKIGTSIPYIKKDDLTGFAFPFPVSEPEQRAIAEALGDVDALLAGLDRLIAKKRDLKQAAMQQLLTGQTRLPGFTGEWEVKRLGDVTTQCFSGATPRRNQPDFYRGNIRWITSGELNYNIITDTIEKISDEAVIATNLSIIPTGIFLMAITGLEAEGTRGACGIVGMPSTTNQSCMAVFPTESLVTNYLFHYYVLRGKQLALQYCQGTKQQSYTAALVKKLPIDLPPTIEEQTAIAEVLSDMDAELAALERRREKTLALKQGMMQELLTGRTRLV